MTAPPIDTRGRAAVVVKTDGVTVYGNRTALKDLARWLDWVADADPAEHYECHFAYYFGGRDVPPRVWVLPDAAMAPVIDHDEVGRAQFDLTFMAVEDHDVDALRRARV